MKKALALLVVSCLFLTGCEETSIEVRPSVNTVQMEYSDFNLVTDEKTGIVYIDNVVTTWKGEDAWKRESHIYTPYYSRLGKLCRFVDGKVVEIE